MRKTLYVVNPGASGGQGEVAWNRFRDLWTDSIDAEDVRVTDRPGHARNIAASAVGYDVIAAVGGDGSVNEALNGVMTRDQPHPSIAIIPAGTGNDIARTIGLFPIETAVSALRMGHEQAFDLIRTDGRDDDRVFTHYAFLSSSVGFSASANAKPWAKRFLGASMAYYLNTILAILNHRPPKMVVQWGENRFEGRTWMVIVANVESVSGGSMRIAPGASPHDGLIWATIVEAQPKLKMLFKNLPMVATGEHLKEEGFNFFSTPNLEITSEFRSIIEPDGEVEWANETTMCIVPNAVRILSPDA